MGLEQVLRDVRRRPGAYGVDGSFREFVIFVNGCDAGTGWKLLDGFGEWLAVRLGYGQNLVWWELVRRISRSKSAESSDDEGDELLIRELFELLAEFLNDKG